jgi:hypothetical protein
MNAVCRVVSATLGSAAFRRLGRSLLAGAAVAALTRPALAHGGSLGAAAGASLSTPPRLVAVTVGLVVGASVLAGTTGRPAGRPLTGRLRVDLPAGRGLWRLGRVLGVLGLAGVVLAGLVGPSDPLANAATVLVWVGWWAGYAASTYLVGNSWPVVGPWRTLSRALPEVGRDYEWRHGAWPSVVALLALTWVAVVGPLDDRPRVLAVTVIAYSAVTLAGAAVYGTGPWFRTVDPVAGVFRHLGRVAPVTADGAGTLTVRVPGAGLAEAEFVDGIDDVAFVVALLWAITYTGVVTTPPWERLATSAVGTGVPPWLVYPLALGAGYALFLGSYLLAAGATERIGESAGGDGAAQRFAPPLLAVAAAAHFAHALGYFLALTPPLFAAVTAPFRPAAATVLVVPDGVGIVAAGGVLFGHVLALRAVRAVAVERCPDRSKAVRTGLPIVAATTWYTLVTLWAVTRPEVAPPLL